MIQKEPDAINLMATEQASNTTTSAKAVYILLLISPIIGITGIIALIMAYVLKDDSADWLQTHYRFSIRTFWIGFLYTMIGLITFGINIGYFILLFTVVWLIVRCAKGLKQLENREPVKNVESWLFT
jgi:uncharacterized membrane protein